MIDPVRLKEAILAGDSQAAEVATREALDAKVEPQELVSKYMIPAMDEIGQRFQAQEVFVPELLIAARAMKAALALVEPLLKDAGVASAGKVVVGTVSGDLHDIGKNLVASMLAGGGFEVIDLGVNVTPAQFTAAVQDKNAQILAMSALLTTTMPVMKSTVAALCEAGVRNRVKVLVGGAPVTSQFADLIGADGYSETAYGAVSLAREIVASSKAEGKS